MKKICTMLLSLFMPNMNAFPHSSFMTKQSVAGWEMKNPSVHTKIYRGTVKRMVPKHMLDLSYQLINSNPKMAESELLGDLAHLMVDFATLFSPDTVALRILVFCGRIISILADYTPDGYITPDELFLQLCLLALSAHAVVKTCILPLQSYQLENGASTLSFRDRRIYQRLFRPAGFTWMQFVSLAAFGAFEWVELSKAGDIIFEDKYDLLLVYEGIIYHLDEDSVIVGDRFGATRRICSSEIIGDVGLVKEKLDGIATMFHSTFTPKNADDKVFAQGDLGFRCLEARTSVAVLLRINTKRLLEAAEKDDLAGESINNFLVRCMMG